MYRYSSPLRTGFFCATSHRNSPSSLCSLMMACIFRHWSASSLSYPGRATGAQSSRFSGERHGYGTLSQTVDTEVKCHAHSMCDTAHGRQVHQEAFVLDAHSALLPALGTGTT